MDAKDNALIKLAKAVIADNPISYSCGSGSSPFYPLTQRCPKCLSRDGHEHDCIVYLAELILRYYELR